jgi:hypothetical protein
MMGAGFDVRAWLDLLLQKLQNQFGARLLFCGLQGSFRRGEAHAQSDIDLVVVLDRLTPADLQVYQRLVRSMPFSQKACGFIAGAAEVRAWPRHDLWTLYHDTEPLFGNLASLLPALDGCDAEQAVRIGAADLYHAACHSFLFGNREENLSGLCKSAYFVLRSIAFLHTGQYPADTAAMRVALVGQDRALLDACLAMRTGSATDMGIDRLYAQLIDWCGLLLRELSGQE